MYNKVILAGRLTRDPELRYTQNNTPQCLFTIATDKFNKHKGEREADFISCIAWNKQAENLVKYCNKGSSILIDGSIHSNSYEDRDGKRVYRQDVTANRITFLNSSKNNNSQQHDNEQNGQEMKQVNFNNDFAQDSAFDPNSFNIMDDDIQF